MAKKKPKHPKHKKALAKAYTICIIIVIVLLGIGSLFVNSHYRNGNNTKISPDSVPILVQQNTPIKTIDFGVFAADIQDFKADMYVIYTYTVWDDITNETSIIRSTIGDEITFTDAIKFLYPVNAKIEVLLKTSADYTRNNTITNWKERR